MVQDKLSKQFFYLGCHRLGYFHGYVDKDKPDAKENAKKVFKMNCEENKFGQSCDSLAGMYLHEQKCEWIIYQIGLF